MPDSRAVLRRTRCAARSKQSGERCRKWSAPGAVVCHLHGAASPQAVAGAQRREVLAELLAADPRPLRVVLRDSVSIADAALRDLRSGVVAGETDPDTIERLITAAGRAAQLARVALDAGIGDDEADVVAQQHGESLARAVRVLIGPLMPRIAAGPADARAISEWLRRAVPAALRREEVPQPPSTWRMTAAPQLESREAMRRREAVAVNTFMAEAEGAVAEGMAAPREDGRPGRERMGIAAPGTVTTSTPLSERVDRDVPLSLADLRAGRGPNAWRDSGSPLTERIGP